jgi:pentatricopeptide repeat protein
MRSDIDLAAPRSIQILDWMEHLLNTGQVDAFPDTQTYNQVILTLSKSRIGGARESLEKVLQKMHQMYSNGLTTAKPDTTSYNCFLHILAKAGSAKEAEDLLERMHMLCDQGLDEIRPNVVSYGTAIDAYANSSHPDAASKGYQLLNKMIHLYQLDPKANSGLRPNTCIFNNTLKCFGKCKRRDSPFKAETILREMDRLHKTGLPVKPDSVTYSTVYVCSGIHL